MSADPPPVLLLDVMGTLVHDPFYVEIPRFFGMTLPQLLEVKHPRAWLDFEHDRIDEATLLRCFFADGRAVDGEGLKAAMHEAYAWLPGIEPLLRTLVERGIPLHAMSNYPRWYALIEDRLGVSRYLPWTFVSCITGLRKPDPAAYQHVLDELEVPASRCVLVDDREANCEGARRAGMDAIRFSDAAQLRVALQDRGVL